MSALIRQSIRRWRHWIDGKIWRAKKRLRQPPREVVALDPIIANARKAHGAVRKIQREKTEITHRLLREGIGR